MVEAKKEKSGCCGGGDKKKKKNQEEEPRLPKVNNIRDTRGLSSTDLSSKEKVYEAKIIFMGEKSVGKTSIIRAFIESNPIVNKHIERTN